MYESKSNGKLKIVAGTTFYYLQNLNCFQLLQFRIQSRFLRSSWTNFGLWKTYPTQLQYTILSQIISGDKHSGVLKNNFFKDTNKLKLKFFAVGFYHKIIFLDFQISPSFKWAYNLPCRHIAWITSRRWGQINCLLHLHRRMRHGFYCHLCSHHSHCSLLHQCTWRGSNSGRKNRAKFLLTS